MSLSETQARDSLAEGNKFIQEARKALSTSVFKWSVDKSSAATSLEKAGTAFRRGGHIRKAISAFIQAAELNEKLENSFRAAQQYEQAATLALSKDNVAQRSKSGSKSSPTFSSDKTAEAKKYIERASSCYGDMGDLQKAADALVKGAKMFEKQPNGDGACLELYLSACDLYEGLEKPHYAVEPFRRTFNVMVKYKQYPGALSLLKRLMSLYTQLDRKNDIYKCFLSTTVLQLETGDVIAADRTFMEHLQDDGYLHSEDCALAEDLVTAFKNYNHDALEETVKKPGFNYLEGSVARLAKKLTIGGNSTGDRKQSSTGISPIKSKQRPKNIARPSSQSSSKPDSIGQSSINKKASNSPEKPPSSSQIVNEADFYANLKFADEEREEPGDVNDNDIESWKEEKPVKAQQSIAEDFGGLDLT